MWLEWYDNKGAPVFDRNAEGRLALMVRDKSLKMYAPFMDLFIERGRCGGGGGAGPLRAAPRRA